MDGNTFATVRSSLPGGWCNREQNDGAEENSAHLDLQVKKNEGKKKVPQLELNFPCAILHSVKFPHFHVWIKIAALTSLTSAVMHIEETF